MYRVLLVDDEESVLKVLKTSIDWQAMGVETPMTAADGMQALEMMERESFHMLITDIKMPRISELELIRRVRCLYPETRCILLTAYSEFDYAKEAIQLGVENYLLKPVQKEELENTVQSTMANLYRRRSTGENMLYDNILHRWLTGSISEEELGERAGVLGLNLYLPQYCVVGITKRRKDSTSSLFRSACLEQLSRQYEVYHCWNDKGMFVMILGGRSLAQDQLEKELCILARQQGAEDQVVAAIGGVVSDPQALHLSYSLVCDMMELADLNQTGVMLNIHADTRSPDADQLIEDLRMFCYRAPGGKDSNVIAVQLYWSVPYKGADECLHHVIYAYLRVLTSEFPEQENSQEQLYKRFGTRSREATGDEAVQMLSSALEWMRADFEKRLDALSPIVRLAIRYIHESVRSGDGGSIKEFSSKTGVNPAYLGHLFKEETGNFFNSYLMQCRINRSVILLKKPNSKIKDVASQVGFASTSYFVRCFRESKGVSPARYRIGREEQS